MNTARPAGGVPRRHRPCAPELAAGSSGLCGGQVFAAGGFTLIEVMIALTLFFTAVFAILDSTAQSLRAARSLQIDVPDLGTLVPDFMLTNRLEEGVVEGDFGDRYPTFHWTRETYLYPETTNGLYQLDFTIYGLVNGRPYQATTSLLLWRPDSDRVIPGLRR